MAKSSFGREPKEMTTEPSADEVGDGMKRGGHAKHKKHMAMGGAPMMPAAMPRRAPMMAARPTMAARPPAMLMRKHGGKAHHAEGGMEHKAEMKEMHKIEKELKHHEKMKDSEHGGKAHAKHGGHMKHMMKGGMQRAVPGGLLGGVEDKGPTKPAGTGGVRSPGYKHGGHTKKHHHADGGLAAKGDVFQDRSALKPKIDVQDKMHEAKQGPAKQTKTGGVEGKGYKHGGHTKKHHYAKGGTVSQSVADRYLNDMHDGEKMPTKKGGTGDVNRKIDAYKHGGHVKHHGHAAHHTTHGHHEEGHMHMHKHAAKHAHGGHEKMEGHPMKHGGHVMTSKMSTHKKAGGKCNY
jgi:hypothetical protein